MSGITEHLKKIFLFESLSDDQLKKFDSFCSIITLQKNKLLFLDGDPALSFYYVISGQVKIYKISPEGTEQILEIRGEGELVAEAAIFDKETYPAFSQTLEPAELIKIPKNDFLNLLRSNSELSLKIIHSYSRRLRYFVNLVEELSLHDLKARLARYLIQNSKKQIDGYTCRLNVSKKELAALLGTIPETLSRTFAFFKKQNILEQQGSLLIINNITALRDFAHS